MAAVNPSLGSADGDDARSVVLRCERVTRRFGGLTAIHDLDFEIREGEIFGLIGPNGAGKTTLMNMVSGVTPPSAGRLFFRGQHITGLPPHRVAQLGIARTFQVMRPFTGLTVRENVAIGARFGSRHGPRSMAQAFGKADEILDWIGLEHHAKADVVRLSTGERKKLELARALAMDPALLLLDEVMAGLNPREIGEVMRLVRRVNGLGVTVVLIEHLMKAVMGLCDRILVLHHGARIALGPPDAVSSDPTVIEAYLGKRFADRRAIDGDVEADKVQR